MKKYIQEAAWAVLPILLALLVFIFLWGINGFFEGTIDINVHDTYFVFAASNFVIAVAAFTGFVLFLARNLSLKFTNAISNYAAIGYTVAFIIVMTYMILLNEQLSVIAWSIHPPLSAGTPPSPPQEPAYLIINTVYLILFQAILLGTLVFTVFKTAKLNLVNQSYK